MGLYVFRASEEVNQRIFSSEMKTQARVSILLLLGSREGERSQLVAMGSSVVLKERVCVHFCYHPKKIFLRSRMFIGAGLPASYRKS